MDELLQIRSKQNKLIERALVLLGEIASIGFKAKEQDELTIQFICDVETSIEALERWKARFWQTQTEEGRVWAAKKGHLKADEGR